MLSYEFTMGILLFLLMLFVFIAKYFHQKYKEEKTKRTWAEEHAQVETNNARENMTIIDQLTLELKEAHALLKKNLQSQNTVNAILPGVQIPKVSDYLKTLPPDTVVTLKMRFIFDKYDEERQIFWMRKNGGPRLVWHKEDIDEYTL